MLRRILAGLCFALGLVLLAVPAWAGDAEVGMVDGSSGEWHVHEPNGSDRNFFYGNPGDTPLIGDWDCDGVETPGMFRPGSGFVYLTNGNPADNGVAVGEIFYYFGIPGDIPIAGDWDGDGCDSPGIYRNGQVFLRDQLSTGFATRSFFFGVPGDRPFAGDWDGDGIDTVGIYRNGTGQIFYTNENPVSGVATTANDFFYGIPSDEFVPGDWDGDGVETVGIYRSSESRFYLRNENSTGTADESFVFGQNGWLPLGGDTELRDASLTASTGLLDFGAVGLNRTGTATLTVNFNGDGGDADLRITSIEFVQPGANFSAAPLTDPDIGFGESRAIEVSMAPTFLGVKRGSIRISHSGTNSPLVVDLIGKASHRVNAGGDPIEDWRADSPFSPGGNVGPLAGTSVSGPTAPDEVFESYRFGQQAWDFPVWPGSYRVNLYFAETFLNSAGARLFDVSIEGVRVLNGFDIFAAAGGKNRGIVRGFDIVSDANLDIDFTEIVNSPAIQGIEIVPMPVLKGLGSTPAEVVFGSTAVGDTLSRTVTIVHLGEPTTGSVNVPGVSIVGADAGQFAIVSGAGARTVTSGNPFNVVVEFRPTTTGVFDAQLFISHSGSNSPLRVDLSGAADDVIVYRLNTGGEAVVGLSSWSPDEPYIVPGTPSGELAIVQAIDTSDQSIPAGTPINVIRTERFGSSQVPLSYDLPVPNGAYEVRLYFVEPVHTASGVRVFDVKLEGGIAINDLDIFARAGRDKAIMIPRQVSVTDGVLDLDLVPIAGKNLPAVHGIEIIKKVGNAFLSADPVSLTLGPIVTSGTATANVEISHDGGAGIPAILIQSVSITGPDSGRFTLLSGPSADDVLPPGTSDTAQIRFTPGVIGDKGANLNIQYNGGRVITVPLVGSVNNAPVMANPGTRTGTEGVAFSVTATATDPDTAGDGDLRTMTATGLPSWASVTASGDGTITIGGTPTFTSAGSSAVTVTVTDPDGLTDSETFTISISNFNRAPTFNQNLGNRTNSEGDVASISAEALDLDGDDLTWSATGLPAGTLINPASGQIGGTIGFNAGPGVYNVTVTVTDNGTPNKSATDTFVWTVTDFNRAPTFSQNLANRTNPEGFVASIPSPATDLDGHGLAYSAAGLPGGISINPGTGLISGTIGFNAGPGVYSVTVTVTDNGTPNKSATDTFVWTVTDFNRAPTFSQNLANRTNPEGFVASIPSPATDLDGHGLAYSAAGLPGGISINPGTGLISGTIGFNAGNANPGVYNVTVTVTDNGSPNKSDTDTFTWTVTNVNQTPTAIATVPGSGVEGVAVAFTGAGTDPDGTIAGYLWDFGDGSSSTQQNPNHTYGTAGTYNGSLIVTDNGGLDSPPDPFTIVIGDRFTLTAFLGGTGDGSVVSAPAGINCPGDCDQLYPDGTSVTVTATPAGGSTFTGWTGSGCAGAGTGPCTITVDADKGFTAIFDDVNDPPTAIATVPGSGVEGVAVAFTGAGTDPDGTIAGYLWDFGDGSSSTQQNPNHTYGTAGTYNGSLIVTDNGGLDSPPDPFTIVIGDRFTLTAFLGGTGDGSVVSAPAGINCPGDCDQLYPDGTSVTVTATPAGGSTFTGWTGSGCAGAGTGPCTITVDADKGFTAIFDDVNDPPTAIATVPGSGVEGVAVAFTGAGTDPDGTIAGYLWDFGDGSSSTQQNPNHTYGTAGTYNGSLIVTDNGGLDSPPDPFTIVIGDRFTLTAFLGGTGDGSVVSAPAGINCPGDCDQLYPDGTSVTVTATPAGGSTFTGWTGSGCAGAGTGPCTITVDADKGFTAIFDDVNDPPTVSAIADPPAFAEGGSTGALAFTVGDDGSLNSLVVTGSSSNQTLVPNGSISFGGSGASRTVTVTGAAGESGTATITVSVDDTVNAPVTETFLVTVTAVNDPPSVSAIADPPAFAEGGSTGALAFTVGDDGSLNSLVVTGSSSNQTLVPNGSISFGGSGASRTVTVTGAAGESGTATITVSVDDTVNAPVTETFLVTVTAVNDPPSVSAIADPPAFAEGGSTGALAFTVGDDGSLNSLVVTGSSSNQTLVPNGSISFGGSGASRTVTVTGAAGESGTATITVSVDDTVNAPVTETFLVTVTAVNDPPSVSAIADPPAFAEGGSTGALAFTVGDDGSLNSLVVTGSSSNQTLVPNGSISFGGSGASRTVTVTGAAGESGTATITVSVDDTVNAPVTETFLVTVTAVNDPPSVSAIADPPAFAEGGSTGALAFTVGDDGSLNSLVVTGSSSNQTLVPNGSISFGGSGASRTVTVTGAAGESGTATITVSVDDTVNAPVTETFLVTVTAVNDPPSVSAIADPPAFAEGGSTGALAFTVGDDGSLNSLVVTGSSSNQTLVPNGSISFGGSGASRTVTVTGAAGESGTATITVSVDDTVNAPVTETFLVTVTAVNDPPSVSAIADPPAFAEGGSTGALAFTVGDDGSLNSLVVTGSSSNQTLVPNGSISFGGSGASRTVTVTGAAGESGTATITVSVDDTVNAPVTETFLVTVTAVNDPPTGLSLSNLTIAAGAPSGTSVGTFTTTDIDSTSFIYTLVVGAGDTDNTLFAIGGAGSDELVTSTDPPLAGTYSVRVRSDDGSVTPLEATFLITVV